MYPLIRPLLMAQEAESAHDFSMSWLKHSQNTPLQCLYSQTLTAKPVTIMGLEFKNPLGLAAGLDKNGECIDAFAAMGFGFVEVGTVTPVAQPGNDKPRLFRLPRANAIINRMGFNNKGVDYLVERVKQSRFRGVLGINIGKNKHTAEKNALDDYLICLKKVYTHASYVTVNISSPNTPGLRNLQYGQALNDLLDGLKQQQHLLAQKHNKTVPLLVKIAPDLSDDEVGAIADSFNCAQVDGVIATNTTLSREKVKGLPYADEAGGLSGEVLTEQSQAVTQCLRSRLDASIPIIGVGGIHDAASAKARIDAGASLLQVYSAFIYQGPGLVKHILRAL